MESRKRKRLLLTIAGTALLLVILLLLYSGEREPTYGGKSLSAWVDVGAMPPLKHSSEAVSAIRAIGTNALPYLLEWISHEPAPWRYHVGALAGSLPERLTGGAPLLRLTAESPGTRRAEAAMEAFTVLGPVALPLLPDLEQLVQRTNVPNASRRALYALSRLGAGAVPAMTNALEHPPYAGSIWAMICANNMGTNARALTPVIARQLTHTNDWIAKWTAYSFIMLSPDTRLDAGQLVPALIRCLQDPRTSVRQLAPFPLQVLGADAAAALPALTNALDDPDPQVRSGAARAIKTIQKHLDAE